jgi:hypothetical protein
MAGRLSGRQVLPVQVLSGGEHQRSNSSDPPEPVVTDTEVEADPGSGAVVGDSQTVTSAALATSGSGP